MLHAAVVHVAIACAWAALRLLAIATGADAYAASFITPALSLIFEISTISKVQFDKFTDKMPPYAADTNDHTYTRCATNSLDTNCT